MLQWTRQGQCTIILGKELLVLGFSNPSSLHPASRVLYATLRDQVCMTWAAAFSPSCHQAVMIPPDRLKKLSLKLPFASWISALAGRQADLCCCPISRGSHLNSTLGASSIFVRGFLAVSYSCLSPFSNYSESPQGRKNRAISELAREIKEAANAMMDLHKCVKLRKKEDRSIDQIGN